MHFYTNVEKYKNFILIRGIKNGEPYLKRLEYKPTLYFPTKKDTPYKSIRGENLQPKKFGKIGHAYNWRKKYSDIPILTL